VRRRSPIEESLLSALIEEAVRRRVRVVNYTASPCEFSVQPNYASRLDIMCESCADDGAHLQVGYEPPELHAGDVIEGRDATSVLCLFRQVRVEGYFVDFLVAASHLHARPVLPWVAVECDGHEFHERTKQQAAYDRSRDRQILRIGVPTIRFTGSEIYRDQFACAAEVLDCASAWLRTLDTDVEDAVAHWQYALLAERHKEQ
jgi:very-short-patch-repair endonuclease